MAQPEALAYAPAPELASLPPALRIKLSVMMFLQYAIWGAFWVVLGIYLGKIDFDPGQIGKIYATTAIASIVSPLIFGQIADRWVATEYLLVGLHVAGAALLYLATRFTDFDAFRAIMLGWALLYIPTISLTNALSLHNVPNAAKHFPGIRVFGTIGWIAAGLFVGAALDDTTSQPILLAALLSAIMGVFCLFLPHTPPTGKPGEAFAFVRAFNMFREPSFTVFMIVSFILSIVLSGYYAFTGPFLKDINIERVAPVAGIMTIGQFSEMLLLPFLPLFLRHFGMKWTLVIGMAAWGLRYGVFSLGNPLWLVIASLALHGLCYDFFFVAAYIHVDNKASVQIRASAQALFNLVVMGLGMWIGNEVFGWLVKRFTGPEKIVNWSQVWFYPTVVVVVALVMFIAGFRERRNPTEVTPAEG
jgi:nucleoside transporter